MPDRDRTMVVGSRVVYHPTRAVAFPTLVGKTGVVRDIVPSGSPGQNHYYVEMDNPDVTYQRVIIFFPSELRLSVCDGVLEARRRKEEENATSSSRL